VERREERSELEKFHGQRGREVNRYTAGGVDYEGDGAISWGKKG